MEKNGEKLEKFPAILWMRGLSDYLSRLPDRFAVSLVPRFRCNRVDSSGLILVGFSLPGASRDKQECCRSVQETSGAARGAQEKRTIERQGSRLGSSRVEARGSRLEG